ncbi:alpha/beta fold hydrolase [Kocuria rhizosphaericola]|uniref:alpha/beta fold hydrolase n=1 Tax=Kocuria rhizosphaericola TaxID=3376284 RepID=UPI0037B53117
MSAPKVILLPGVVLPADLAYAGLITVLGDAVEVVVKDLEVYRQASPPPGYSLDIEVEGVLGEADVRGWDRFHLVGYSGGGAAALACAASHPGRLLSLGVLEPAWVGSWDWSPQHKRLWAQYDDISQLPHDQFMAAFMRLRVRPGVPLPAPPLGPPPPWMLQRPGGIRALMGAFHTYDLDREALAAFDRPVYFALGGLSNPDQFAEIAERLGNVFADFTLEVFPERHHFDPPHRTEPARLAQSLMAIWSRGDQMTGQADP